MPMTVNVFPATVIVDPTLRFCAWAWSESTTATFESDWAVVMLCPEVIVPEASGPSESPAGSTPVTVNELLLIDPDPEPPEPPWAPGWPPPAESVPESFTSFRTSAPAAPETSFRPETVVTDEDLIDPIPPPARMSRLKLVPAFCWPDGPPAKLKRVPPPEPAVGDWVMVVGSHPVERMQHGALGGGDSV